LNGGSAGGPAFGTGGNESDEQQPPYILINNK